MLFPSYLAPLFVLVQNLSTYNAFDLHENESVGGTHFYVNCFARSLVLTQRQKATQSEMVYQCGR